MSVPRPSLRDLGLVVLAVATVAMTVVALRPAEPPGGDQVSVATATGAPSPGGTSPGTGPTGAGASPGPSAPPAPPRALFVGDTLLRDGAEDFPAQLSRARNWVGRVDSGGAFATTGLPERLAGSYDVVMLCALEPPAVSTSAQARAAALASVQVARDAQPDAALLLVGPLALGGDPSQAATVFNDVLKQVGREQDVPVISPIDERWIVTEGAVIDPTRQVVQDIIAARLTEAVARRPQVPRGAPVGTPSA